MEIDPRFYCNVRDLMDCRASLGAPKYILRAPRLRRRVVVDKDGFYPLVLWDTGEFCGEGSNL